MKNRKGFTIVELVIVIAVIAILAAVLIPTFSGIINRANESVAMQETKNTLTEVISQNGECKSGTMFYHPDAEGTHFTTFLYADGALTEIGVLTYGTGVTTSWATADGLTGITLNESESKIVYAALKIGSYTVSGEASYQNMSTGYGKSFVSANATISMYSTSAYINVSYTDAGNIVVSGEKIANAPKNADITLHPATGKKIDDVTVKVDGADVTTGITIAADGSSVVISKSVFNGTNAVNMSVTITGSDAN